MTEATRQYYQQRIAQLQAARIAETRPSVRRLLTRAIAEAQRALLLGS
jgi:hypothetical protein